MIQANFAFNIDYKLQSKTLVFIFFKHLMHHHNYPCGYNNTASAQYAYAHTLISTFCVPHCLRMYVARATEYSTKADLNGCCVYFL